MNKKLKEAAMDYAQEMKAVVLSMCESLNDAADGKDASMTKLWNIIDRAYIDLEAMRNRQKCTGAKSFSITACGDENEVDGHTKYLQGLNLPIMVNSIINEDGTLSPSEVCEMHIGVVEDSHVLLITPDIVG